MTDPKHARSKSENKRVKAQGGEILPPQEQMPERVWLTATASESLRDIIPYQFDHDECDTEYIRADLTPAIDVEAIVEAVDRHQRFYGIVALDFLRNILTEALGGQSDD